MQNQCIILLGHELNWHKQFSQFLLRGNRLFAIALVLEQNLFDFSQLFSDSTEALLSNFRIRSAVASFFFLFGFFSFFFFVIIIGCFFSIGCCSFYCRRGRLLSNAVIRIDVTIKDVG